MDFISVLKSIFIKRINFIDIGAYHGDFTKNIIDNFTDYHGILIEPTINNYNVLQKRFFEKQHLKIFNSLLTNEKKEVCFNLYEDSAQNSTFKIIGNNISGNEQIMFSDTLDYLLSEQNISYKIDLIKIDTQGNDLNILNGSVGTISKYRPVILTEFIFIPLYYGQGDYFRQLEFMSYHKYSLIGLYNIHYNEADILSFADLLFVPNEIYNTLAINHSPFSNYKTSDSLLLSQENNKLKLVCEERLQEINKLSIEAQKRLDIINLLNKELEKYKGNKT